MIIKPKIRGFICITAHPEGCRQNVAEQIAYVQQQGVIAGAPKRVLVIGSSTGYGLASRIVAAFGYQADTIGVYFERPEIDGKPASAGFYNARAFDEFAHQAERISESINGDAFSDAIKQETIQRIQQKLGQVDLVIYSLASPRRTDPETGEVYKSVLKPVGEEFRSKTVNTDTGEVHEILLSSANDEEIAATCKVMGGEDWERWIDQMLSAGVLAEGAQTYAYSYLGPKVTWPIYAQGTIGKAKEDLTRTAGVLNKKLEAIGGRAAISVNKAVVTQASSAIPVVPLYLSVLFKVMKQKDLHEGCIEQMYRLFASNFQQQRDELGRIRMDDRELQVDVQTEVESIWPQITTENLKELTNYGDYTKEFLRLFGFGLDGVDYEQEVTLG